MLLDSRACDRDDSQTAEKRTLLKGQLTMTKSEAIKKAKERAKSTGYDFFVITEPDWRSNYQVCDEVYLESYYYGCNIICCVEPHGYVHY